MQLKIQRGEYELAKAERVHKQIYDTVDTYSMWKMEKFYLSPPPNHMRETFTSNILPPTEISTGGNVVPIPHVCNYPKELLLQPENFPQYGELLTFSKSLVLMSVFTGCHHCHAKNQRTVAFWAIQKRFCLQCAKQLFISNVVLAKDYGISDLMRVLHMFPEKIYFFKAPNVFNSRCNPIRIRKYTDDPRDFENVGKVGREMIFVYVPDLERVIDLKKTRQNVLEATAAVNRICAHLIMMRTRVVTMAQLVEQNQVVLVRGHPVKVEVFRSMSVSREYAMHLIKGQPSYVCPAAASMEEQQATPGLYAEGENYGLFSDVRKCALNAADDVLRDIPVFIPCDRCEKRFVERVSALVYACDACTARETVHEDNIEHLRRVPCSADCKAMFMGKDIHTQYPCETCIDEHLRYVLMLPAQFDYSKIREGSRSIILLHKKPEDVVNFLSCWQMFRQAFLDTYTPVTLKLDFIDRSEVMEPHSDQRKPGSRYIQNHERKILTSKQSDSRDILYQPVFDFEESDFERLKKEDDHAMDGILRLSNHLRSLIGNISESIDSMDEAQISDLYSKIYDVMDAERGLVVGFSNYCSMYDNEPVVQTIVKNEKVKTELIAWRSLIEANKICFPYHNSQIILNTMLVNKRETLRWIVNYANSKMMMLPCEINDVALVDRVESKIIRYEPDAAYLSWFDEMKSV